MKLKNLFRTIIILIIFTMMIDNLFSNDEQCINIIKEVSNQYRFMLKDNQIYYLNYSTRTKMRDKRYVISEVDIEILANASKLIVKSDQMSVFQDTTIQYIVVPSRKEIYINSAKNGINKSEQLNMFSNLLDKMFEKCKIINCQDQANPKGLSNKIITIKVDEGAIFPMGGSTIEYHIDISNNSIMKINVKYPPTYNVESIDLNVKKTDFNYKTDALKAPVRKNLYGNNGLLLPEYSKYRIIDTRKNN